MSDQPERQSSDANSLFQRLLASGGPDIKKVKLDKDDPGNESLLQTMNAAAECSNAGIEALQKKEYGAALSFFWASVAHERTIGSPFRLANDYGNLGTAYLRLGYYTEARAALDESLRLYGLANSAAGAAKTYYWLAHWELHHRNLSGARQFAQWSLLLFEKHEHVFAEGSRELLQWIEAREGEWPAPAAPHLGVTRGGQ